MFHHIPTVCLQTLVDDRWLPRLWLHRFSLVLTIVFSYALSQGQLSMGGHKVSMNYSTSRDRDDDWFCSQVGSSGVGLQYKLCECLYAVHPAKLAVRALVNVLIVSVWWPARNIYGYYAGRQDELIYGLIRKVLCWGPWFVDLESLLPTDLSV